MYDQVLLEEDYGKKTVEEMKAIIREKPVYRSPVVVIDVETGLPTKLRLTVGVDGVTEDDILFLMLWDKREETQNRKARDNEDLRVESIKAKGENEVDSMESIMAFAGVNSGDDVSELVCAKTNPSTEIVDITATIINEELSEKQRNTLYDYYGAGLTLEEIGKADGKTKEAAFKRLHGAVKKVEKQLAKRGINKDSFSKFGIFTGMTENKG